jgi:alkanesulfonate monooxygenase SsuD/methylene tetrahydromethanopterin reductase-like flavin-dependent oxidoreductase (luciferase family)
MRVPLSILDLAAVGREETIAESFAGSVELARAAERCGYRRIWSATRARCRGSRRSRLFGRGRKLSEEDVTALLESTQAAAVDEMLAYTAVGLAEKAAAYLMEFAAETEADELITVHYSDSVPNRLRSVELLAGAIDPGGAARS